MDERGAASLLSPFEGAAGPSPPDGAAGVFGSSPGQPYPCRLGSNNLGSISFRWSEALEGLGSGQLTSAPSRGEPLFSFPGATTNQSTPAVPEFVIVAHPALLAQPRSPAALAGTALAHPPSLPHLLGPEDCCLHSLEELTNNRLETTPRKASQQSTGEEGESPALLPRSATAPPCSPAAKLALAPPLLSLHAPEALPPGLAEPGFVQSKPTDQPASSELVRPGDSTSCQGLGAVSDDHIELPGRASQEVSMAGGESSRHLGGAGKGSRGSANAVAAAPGVRVMEKCATAAGMELDSPTSGGSGGPAAGRCEERGSSGDPQGRSSSSGGYMQPSSSAGGCGARSAGAGGKAGPTGIAAGLTLEFLEGKGYFDMPLQKAAALLRVGVTTLKKVCRQYNIERWPFRKRSSLDRLIVKTREYFSEDRQQQGGEALARLEAEKQAMKGNVGVQLPDQVKRFRQSVFKLEHKARKRASKCSAREACETSPNGQGASQGKPQASLRKA
ncbi:hypothetical protein N2152v2_001809 [Parachlorella kessleri]|uniref:RWP-RK transcription factor n=1 Tax=Parachlorella kessleri TaxID=3074 RepID=A0A292G2R1_PARKE|nr:RWP-RK transcription factor [Parachlorella kessleri]